MSISNSSVVSADLFKTVDDTAGSYEVAPITSELGNGDAVGQR